MATEVEDTPAPWSTKGSRVYGLDTPWVEGNKASGYAIEYANKEILRVSIKGFVLNRRRRDFKGKLAILRVDQRTVALQLFHSLLGWNKTHLLLINPESVLLLPCTCARTADFQCMLQKSHNSKRFLFDFETMQDLFKFQEFFTGFSAQIHIPHVAVRWQPKGRESPTEVISDIQLWKKVPSRSESSIHTHDGLRTPPQLPETGAKRDLLEHGEDSTQIHTTTASNKGLVSVNGSVIKRNASLLLVFSGCVLNRRALIRAPFSRGPSTPPFGRVPIDGRISIAKWGPRGLKLVEDGAKTSYIFRSKPFGSIAQRSSATASGAAGSIALGLTATGSNVQASRFSEIDNSDSQELDWVTLGFDYTLDRAAFVAALKALIDPHEFLYEAETHDSNRQSLEERGSLTRKYESAVFDADDVIPPAKQTSANPKLTPLHKAEAGQVNSSAPLSQPRRGLAGEPTNHPDGRADMVPLVAASLDSKFRPQKVLAGNSTIHPDGRADIVPLVARSLDSDSKFHGRNRSFDVLDADQQRSGNYSNTSNVGEMRRLRSDSMGNTRGEMRTPRIRFPLPLSTEPPYAAHIANISFSTTEKDISDFLADCTLTDVRITEKRLEGGLGGFAYATFATLEGLEKALDLSSTLLHDRHIGISVAAPRKYAKEELHVVAKEEFHIVAKEGFHIVAKEGFHIVPNITDRDSFIEATYTPKSGTTDSTSTDKGTKESNQVLRLLDAPPHSETSVKQMQRRRRICRKLVLFMLWKWEQNDGVPKEMWSSPASFEFITGLTISRFDKIKSLFEAYSGREWDWWPFDPPAKPLESGKVRIRWQCTCGDQRWTDASRYLARKCQALVNENTTAGHESGNATSQSSASAASHSHFGSVVPGSFPSDTSPPTGVTSNIRSTAQASHIQDTNKSSHSKDLYVLLCIFQGSQILHSQILASKCQNDEAFFENLRREYRRLRGFFRFWFSPLQFSHCDFVKFTRFYVNELAKVGYSLPIDLVYQYNPRPPGPHEDPPISPHEFRRRFYTHFANPCGRDEALERIPKRQKRFQVNLHVDGREDMWGLHIELRPCFLVVLVWQIVLTAGGWAFMGWWLSRHHGDLQNAAVVTLIVMAVMALWAPISKGMTEAL